MNDILSSAREQLQKAVDFFQSDLAQVRTGRATPAMLDSIRAEYYDTPTPLNQLATINAPEPLLLTIQAWDASVIPAIVHAIQKSDLSVNPVVDGQLIRVPFPSLTEERRQELVRIAKQKAEAAKVAVRSIREEVMRHIKNAESEKLLSEDQAEALRKELQKEVDATNASIQETTTKREAEILHL